MVVTQSEPRRFGPEGVELITRLADTIRPETETMATWFEQYRREHADRLVADLELIKANIPPGARILEYGAVPLIMTSALAASGYDVTGLDVAPERFAASIDQLHLNVEKCDVEVEPVPFADEAFDAVIFNELFEHLRINPIFTMREVYRVQKPGAALFLSTPNLRSLRGLRNLIIRNLGHAASSDVYHQYEKLETLGHMGHVREYTTREVSDFLTHIGFSVEKLIYRGGHGKGMVGIAERLLPSLRPSFTIVARKTFAENPERGGDTQG